jgi:hypothetical protein
MVTGRTRRHLIPGFHNSFLKNCNLSGHVTYEFTQINSITVFFIQFHVVIAGMGNPMRDNSKIG